MRVSFVITSAALTGLLAVGCGSSQARQGDGDGSGGGGTTRTSRGGSRGRLPDPLPAGVDIIPEDQMTPAQLVDALGSLDAARRARAHDRLQRFGEAAESEIVGGLNRSEEHIRAQCAHVLGVLGEPGTGASIVYALIKMVEGADDSPYARGLGIWALGRIRLHGQSAARDKVGRTAFFYLNHPDAGVRSHAAETIRRQAYRPAVERLIGMLDPRNAGAPQSVLERQYLRDALKDITFEDFGLDANAWADWWALNADRVFGA